MALKELIMTVFQTVLRRSGPRGGASSVRRFQMTVARGYVVQVWYAIDIDDIFRRKQSR